MGFEDALTARLIYVVIGVAIGAIALVTLFYEALQKLKVDSNGAHNLSKGLASNFASSFTYCCTVHHIYTVLFCIRESYYFTLHYRICTV